MIQSTLVPFVAATLMIAPGVGVRPSPSSSLLAGEREALIAASDASLGGLRAGDEALPGGFSGAERAELAKAQAASSTLGSQRAGDVNLSDRDLTIIGVVVLAVILIAIIA